uniref:IS4 family transposase n=1 Tax=Effusibacillus pohliae TaxID=232270 RepID=UPI0003A75C76|nr:IS4 family transposase [Effusibacillus pohliae]
MDKDTLFSAFGKWVEPLNRIKLQEKIDAAKQDKYVKKLTTKAYILLFLHAVQQKREGLRAIADDLVQEEFQQALGLESISAAQLSRRHRQVDPGLLAGIFYDLTALVHTRSNPTSLRRRLNIVDSSTISLCLQKYKWAVFRETKAGIKMHLRLVFASQDDVAPDKVALTPAKRHDRTQMDELIDESGAMYVFDRGYVDYKKFDGYCERGIFFVTRLKENAVFELVDHRLVEHEQILSDSIILLGTPQNQMKHLLRLVEAVDSQGHVIQIVTNRFDITAEEIGEMFLVPNHRKPCLSCGLAAPMTAPDDSGTPFTPPFAFPSSIFVCLFQFRRQPLRQNFPILGDLVPPRSHTLPPVLYCHHALSHLDIGRHPQLKLRHLAFRRQTGHPAVFHQRHPDLPQDRLRTPLRIRARFPAIMDLRAKQKLHEVQQKGHHGLARWVKLA